jgi:hypothetical protein
VYTGRSRFTKDRSRIVLGVARVHDDWLACLLGQLYLGRERFPLLSTRRIVVMIVETAFADGDGFAEERAQEWNITRGVESGGVVGMDTCRGEDEAGICDCDRAGDLSRGQRFTDADDRSRARIAGAGYYVVAVTVERRVREVGVAVDEDGRMPPV